MCVSVDNDLSEWTKHSIHHPEEPQGEVLSGSVLSARSYQEHHSKCERFFFFKLFSVSAEFETEIMDVVIKIFLLRS